MGEREVVIVAVLIVLVLGGRFLLRWQQDRQQFLLARAALEKGITRLPSGLPIWLVSLRQGVMILVLGVGLLILGAVMYSMARQVKAPPPRDMVVFFGEPGDGRGPATQTQQRPDDPRAPAGMERDFDRPVPPPPPPPPGAGGMPERRGPERAGEPRDIRGGRPGGGPWGGMPSPAVEQWRRAQDQIVLAIVAMGVGGVLVLLGAVRTIFALVERRYVEQTAGES